MGMPIGVRIMPGLSGATMIAATSGAEIILPLMFTFTTATNGAYSMTVKTDAARTLYVLWGDGSALEAFACTAADTVISHNYASGATKTVTVYGTPAWLTKLDLGAMVVFGLDVSGLTGLTWLAATGAGNTVTGSVAALTALTYMVVTGNNTLTGSVTALTSLATIHVFGSNTLTGSIAALTSLTYLDVEGNNTISGSVAALTSLTVLVAYGNNTLTGSVALLTLLEYLMVGGSNTITWAVGPLTALATLDCSNNALSQATIDAILLAMYTNRAGYTNAAPTAVMGGTNAAPSGLYQPECPPTSGLEMAYELVNDSCGDGFNKWAITTSAVAFAFAGQLWFDHVDCSSMIAAIA